jgi:hypothetical protein
MNDTLAALALGRAKARPYTDELKHAPTLGMTKMERQGVLTDALPVLVLGSKFIVGAGFDFGSGLGVGDGLRRGLPWLRRLPLTPTACISGR